MADIESKSSIKRFWCHDCKRYWESSDYVIVDPDDFSESLDNFISPCPSCGQDTYSAPHYYANLATMSARATGPRSSSGKERVSRNAVKHGLYSSPHNILYPSKPDKYPECEHCPQRQLCIGKELSYCVTKTDMLLKVLAAYKTKDVNMLNEFAGFTQGKLMITLNDMFADLMKHGVTLDAPKVNGYGEVLTDEHGKPIRVISANPLLSHLAPIIQTLGFSSDQQQMNPAKMAEKDELNNPGKAAAAGQAILSAIMGFAEKVSDFKKQASDTREQDDVYRQLKQEDIQEDDISMDIPSSCPFPGN